MLRAIRPNLPPSFKLIGFLLAAVLPSAVGADIRNSTFTYDALGRLTTACDAAPDSGNLTVYKFDPAGNRQTYQHSRTEQTLALNAPIYSPNGKIILIMQDDGNLVVYGNFGAGWTPLGWASNTVGSGATHASFQSDGNLVVYTAAAAVWASGTSQYHCATLFVQDDGNVVIKDIAGQIVWQTNTGGH